MEFQTLKRSHKKQIIIGALAICVIGGALTFATTRAKYKLTEEIEIAKGTINYKPYDFKIMAMYKSEDKTNYTEINEMPSEGYIINESKSYCNMSNGNKDTTAILKTINGNHTIGKLKKNDRCYLYFDKKEPTSEDTLAKLNITVNNGTPDFSKVATTDEGVYKVSDGMYGGYSYYWRGAVTNNYVKFANKCWRIVRINGDGSMRLIYDGTTCHNNGGVTTDSIAVTDQAYNSNKDRSEYVGYTYTIGSQRTTSGTASNLKTQNETWYNSNLASYASKIADGKYCNDRNTGSGYSWSSQPSSTFYYAGYDRSGAKSSSSVSPTLSCPSGDVYTLKVGAITMDEVVMAGGKWGTSNSSYYLYNGDYYWTMSPYDLGVDSSGSRYANVFIVCNNGFLGNDYANWTRPGVRPVINLKADTLFATGGNGTQSNPYVVS